MTIAPVGSDAPGVAELSEGWGALGLAIGEPVDINSEGPLPAGGVQLTRSYPEPLAEGQAATWAFFDQDLGSWRAVPSKVPADRLSVTAVVHHLSLWTDFVGWAGDKASQAFDWAYYQVGKVFDVRVDPPGCHEDEPSWVADSTHIAADRNNPVLFCTGHDEKQPDLVVVKARVNRGFAFQIEAPGGHAWDYNSSYQQSDLDKARAAVTDLGATFADAFAQLVSTDGIIAPGEEYSFGLTEAAARDLPAYRAVVLTPPNAAGFLISALGQLVGTEVGLLVDGYAAAAIGTASCIDRLTKADDGGSWARALAVCVASIDEAVAKVLAAYLLKRGMAEKAAGKLAGQIVGKITIYLALIGPVFNTINYALERTTAKDARTVWIHPKVKLPSPTPTAGAPTRTEVVQVWPVDPYGDLKPGYAIEDTLNGARCSYGSSYISTFGFRCVVGSIIYDPCWYANDPGTDEPSVMCLPNPWETSVVHLVGLWDLTGGDEFPDDLPPWGVELAGGERCREVGGARSEAFGRAVAFVCEGGSLGVLADLDSSGAVWTGEVVRYADDTYTSLGRQPLVKVWLTTDQ